MTEMVERVAQALNDDWQRVTEAPAWDGMCEGLKETWRAAARVAIAAMREPTEAMVLAACAQAAEEQVRPVAIHRADAALVWRAMIQAASKPALVTPGAMSNRA